MTPPAGGDELAALHRLLAAIDRGDRAAAYEWVAVLLLALGRERAAGVALARAGEAVYTAGIPRGPPVDTQAAILRSIAARPDDDTPRLGYADFLEDYAADLPSPTLARRQAEFIRLSIELAAVEAIEHDCGPDDEWVSTCPACGAHGAAEETRQRLAAILGECGPSWLPIFDGAVWQDSADGQLRLNTADGRQFDFDRGFVASVTCPAADWLAHAAAILAAHPVRRVTLTDWTELAADLYSEEGWTHDPATDEHTFPRWPGVRFTIPQPEPGEFDPPLPAEGEWVMDLHPGGGDSRFDRRPAQARLVGLFPAGIPFRPRQEVGPLTARDRRGVRYRVPRAVVADVTYDGSITGPGGTEVGAVVVGEFEVLPPPDTAYEAGFRAGYELERRVIDAVIRRLGIPSHLTGVPGGPSTADV